MNTKKTFMFALLVIFVLAIASFTLADDTDSALSADDVDDSATIESEDVEEVEISEQDKKETRVMHKKRGLKLRYLQLERAITRAVEGQKIAISFVQEKYLDVETTELEDINAELSALLELVKEVDFEVGEDLITNFIDLRDESKELVKLFRENIHEILEEGDIAKLRARIKEMKKERLTELDEQIKLKRREYNTEKVQEVLSRLGVKNDKLIASVEKGDVNLKQIKNNVIDKFSKLSPEKKRLALQKATKVKKELDVKKLTLARKLKVNGKELIKTKVQNRLVSLDAARRVGDSQWKKQ